MNTKDILKDKRYPNWIINHPIFKEIDKVKKVFPSIGLPNFEDDYTFDNTANANKAAKSLVRSISIKIDDKIRSMQAQLKLGKVEKKRASYEQAIAILTSVGRSLDKPATVIVKDKEKLSLKLPCGIQDANGKVLYKAGESLFRVYNKLNDILRSKDVSVAAMRALDTLAAFKRFSTDNVPSRTYKIVFSSASSDGLWDIATMSERGIHSCQSWNGDYKYHLIGSMLDPFVGIMYLTSGEKLKLGRKMMRRAVVRFVIGKDKRPSIIIDRLYPSHDMTIANAFVKSIKDKVGDKFDVSLTSKIKETDARDMYTPLTELRDKLLKYNSHGGKEVYDRLDSIASYQDFHIKDKKPASAINDKQAALYAKNSHKKAREFVNDALKAMGSVIDDVERERPNLIPKANILGFYQDHKRHTLSDIIISIAEAAIHTVCPSDFTNSDTYIRRVYYNYFNLRSKILDENKAKLTKEFNGKLNLSKANKLQAKQFVAMMNELLPKVDVIMKQHLGKLVEKRKFSGPLPLP